MKRNHDLLFLVFLLILVSILVYLAQIILFQRPGETSFYLLQDLAFVPINVLLVTLGLNTIMIRRERQFKLEKVSIVINEFFTETGTDMIRSFIPFIGNLESALPNLQPGAA